MAKAPKLSTNLSLAAALLDGATVVAHLCSKKPATPEDIAAASLGSGTFTAEGGQFNVKLNGMAACVAVAWEGKVAHTKPSKLPLRVYPGLVAKVGPLVFGTPPQ